MNSLASQLHLYNSTVHQSKITHTLLPQGLDWLHSTPISKERGYGVASVVGLKGSAATQGASSLPGEITTCNEVNVQPPTLVTQGPTFVRQMTHETIPSAVGTRRPGEVATIRRKMLSHPPHGLRVDGGGDSAVVRPWRILKSGTSRRINRRVQ